MTKSAPTFNIFSLGFQVKFFTVSAFFYYSAENFVSEYTYLILNIY